MNLKNHFDMRDETEVQKMADKAASAANHGTKYPGMSYEEGLREALDWVLDESIPEDESPLE